MKRVIAVILFLSLTGPVTFTYFWLQYQKKMVRREVKHQLIDQNMDQLEILMFTENEVETELTWTKPHEFEYKGEMYDVVETTFSNGKIVYRCWHDNAETQLNRKLNNLLAYALSSNPSRNKSVKDISLFYKNLYFSQTQVFLQCDNMITNTSSVYKGDNYSSLHFSPPVPPPEFI